jgi:hypothetical protein
MSDALDVPVMTGMLFYQHAYGFALVCRSLLSGAKLAGGISPSVRTVTFMPNVCARPFELTQEHRPRSEPIDLDQLSYSSYSTVSAHLSVMMCRLTLEVLQPTDSQLESALELLPDYFRTYGDKIPSPSRISFWYEQ